MWSAPTVNTPVHATVTVPGSKSMTNRALILAALAAAQGGGASRIDGALRSRDTDLMIGALRTLGFDITGDGADLTVQGALHPAPGARIDCGLAGTVLRFVPPLAALGNTAVVFDGDEQARSRPITPLLDGLRGLGVDIDGSPDGGGYRSPCTAAAARRAARCTSTPHPPRNSSPGCCCAGLRSTTG